MCQERQKLNVRAYSAAADRSLREKKKVFGSQSRQGLRKSNRADHDFFASLRLCANKKSIWLAKPLSRKGFPDFGMQAFPSFKFTSIKF
jgi:hypothetical protein